MDLTKPQRNAVDTAARLRAMSRRCNEFAKLVGYRSVADRLKILAVKYKEQASEIENGAGLYSNGGDPDELLSRKPQASSALEN